MRGFARIAVVISSVLLAACATHIKPSTMSNPPPTEKFSAFDRFELKPIVLSAAYADHDANQKAAAKIQAYFDERIKPVVNQWNNGKGETNDADATTLVIEPRIEHIKFIGIGARIWVGPLAGSSAVVMKVRYVDKRTGKVIAEPEFYQRAAAMSGAFTFGGQDNAMLARISTLVADYNTRNYAQRVGGESGATPDTEIASN